MAPFKLKFRMGSSRSTSQEHDPDPQVNEALLNHHNSQQNDAASTSTLDSVDCNSLTSFMGGTGSSGLGSSSNNERRALLPSATATHQSSTAHKSNTFRLGYLRQSNSQCANETVSATTNSTTVPSTPPPSYEYVLEELQNTHISNYQQSGEHSLQRQASADDNSNSSNLSQQQQQRQQQHQQQQQQQQQQHRESRRSSTNSFQTNPLEEYYTEETCTDPNCQENIAYNERLKRLQQRRQQQQQQQHQNSHNDDEQDYKDDLNDNNYEEIYNSGAHGNGNTNVNYQHNSGATTREQRKNSVDSTEYLLSSDNMTAPSSQENLLDECHGECQHYGGNNAGNGDDYCLEDHGTGDGAYGHNNCDDGGDNQGLGASGTSNDFCDPLMNRHGYCNDESHSHGQMSNECQQQQCHHHHHHYQQQQQQHHGGDDGVNQQQQQQFSPSSSSSQRQQQQHQQQQYTERSLTPEYISNKSSKEIYKDLAKQWGITCKMSDGCRCMECQSHYFDCEFDENEHQKTDGGLGAGTPMFISEVMHGSACNIL